MKLVAMLRVKNQVLTIRDCLDRLIDLVDEIVIVDNGSTDGTIDIYKEYKKIVAVSYTEGFDEGRDKIFAHEIVKTRNPDWILWIDADEVFERSLNRADLEKYMNNSKLNAVWFRLFHFWGDKFHIRIDSKWLTYTAHPQRVMWRNMASAYFQDLKFHNGAILGVPGKHIISTFRLKHFGYVYPQQIKAKHETYSKLKGDKRSIKTMPLDISSMRRIKFIETENRFLDRIVGLLTHLILKSFVLINSVIKI